jgi:hypothetical protein
MSPFCVDRMWNDTHLLTMNFLPKYIDLLHMNRPLNQKDPKHINNAGTESENNLHIPQNVTSMSNTRDEHLNNEI